MAPCTMFRKNSTKLSQIYIMYFLSIFYKKIPVVLIEPYLNLYIFLLNYIDKAYVASGFTSDLLFVQVQITVQ